MIDVYCRMKSRCLISIEEYLCEEDLNTPRRIASGLFTALANARTTILKQLTVLTRHSPNFATTVGRLFLLGTFRNCLVPRLT